MDGLWDTLLGDAQLRRGLLTGHRGRFVPEALPGTLFNQTEAVTALGAFVLLPVIPCLSAQSARAGYPKQRWLAASLPALRAHVNVARLAGESG